MAVWLNFAISFHAIPDYMPAVAAHVANIRGMETMTFDPCLNHH